MSRQVRFLNLAVRVPMSLAGGVASIGGARGIDQASHEAGEWLWAPGSALNPVLGKALGWSESVTRFRQPGVLCEQISLVIITCALIWFATRRLTSGQLHRAGAITMVITPWLANADAIIVVFVTANAVIGVAAAILIVCSTLIGVLFSFALSGLRVRLRQAALLADAVLIVGGVYWLHSMLEDIYQWTVLTCAVILFVQQAFVRHRNP